MSYPERAAPRRPGTVLAAAALLLVMAVGAVAYAVVNLAVSGGTVDRFRDAAAERTGASGGDVDQVAGLLRGSTVLAAVLGVLAALLLVGLALGLLAGRSGARTATWVVAGTGLLCGCCGLAVLVGQRAAPLRLGADDRITADLLGLVGDAYPSWWIPVNATLSVAQILGYLVVAVLLTLPSSGAFLRRRTAPLRLSGYGSTVSGAAAPGPTPWGPPPGLKPPPSVPPATPPGGFPPPPEDSR
ncbi:hypothetical protein O7630_29965 [Micromonospora sp. WMMD718]|uniref:hypothetical protein n=1 Tax=unclassified Micromonospora TaxID=2617518 RepID=UPI00064BC4AD|nr:MULTISPECIES: hypothetical protein [unclassified Micromonospora]MDG4755172.1 hypothetical protein [Micromonospora sp. WMMD718]